MQHVIGVLTMTIQAFIVSLLLLVGELVRVIDIPRFIVWVAGDLHSRAILDIYKGCVS